MLEKNNIELKARLILYNKGKILLLKQTKPNGGNFSLVGGTVEKEEYAKESLIRESREEAGIILQPEDLQLVHVMHKHHAKKQRIILYFKAKKWYGILRAKERKKFEKVEWFRLNDLPKNITPTVRQALKHYKKGQLYSEMYKNQSSSHVPTKLKTH